MAEWYALAVENARRNPKAQEHHNADPDPRATGMTPPNAKAFLEHINVFDCSKVTDGASALILASEEGLEKLGVAKDKAAQIVGIGHCEGDLTKDPPDLCKLTTSEAAAAGRAGVGRGQVLGARAAGGARLLLHHRAALAGGGGAGRAGQGRGLPARRQDPRRRRVPDQHDRRAVRLRSPHRRHRRAAGGRHDRCS